MPHPTERALSSMPIRQWPHHEHFGRTTHYPLVQASLAQRMGAKFSHSCVPVHARKLTAAVYRAVSVGLWGASAFVVLCYFTDWKRFVRLIPFYGAYRNPYYGPPKD
jgi:hypothetical protein